MQTGRQYWLMRSPPPVPCLGKTVTAAIGSPRLQICERRTNMTSRRGRGSHRVSKIRLVMTEPNYCLTIVVRHERGADEIAYVMRKMRPRDGRVLGVAVVAAFVWAAAVASAASPQQEEPSRPEPTPLRKVINELSSSRWTATPPAEGLPTFRTSVTVHENLTPPWVVRPRTAAPRPRGSLYHEEFLVLVTPGPSGKSAPTPAAQASTDPGELLQGVKTWWRARQAKRERESAEREIAALR